MQHAYLRHGTRTLFQGSALAVLASLLIGDMGGTMAVVMDAASTMGALAYSRHYETEADEGAARMLRRARVDVAGLADFFRRIEQIQPDTPGALTYFSTHPATEARIAAAPKRSGGQPDTRPLMDSEAWAALQEHAGMPWCAAPKPRARVAKPWAH